MSILSRNRRGRGGNRFCFMLPPGRSLLLVVQSGGRAVADGRRLMTGRGYERLWKFLLCVQMLRGVCEDGLQRLTGVVYLRQRQGPRNYNCMGLPGATDPLAACPLELTDHVSGPHLYHIHHISQRS